MEVRAKNPVRHRRQMNRRGGRLQPLAAFAAQMAFRPLAAPQRPMAEFSVLLGAELYLYVRPRAPS
jgi:hypothetical protein